ncbi:MAG: TetR/AcrR family transcriptional regulator [Microbacterium sp.]|nr:MAG: TetR/AcrR family transcriptional regulator [Microbacterium sp.]
MTEQRRRGRPPLEGRREEILDAAVEVMAVHGIEAISLNQLADELGLSTYALTYHFGSKEGLLVAIAEHVGHHLRGEFGWLNEIKADDLDVGTLVRGYWASYGSTGAAGSTRLWLEIGILASRDPERFPGFIDAMVDGWRGLIRSFVPDHPFVEDIASITFATLLGLELLEMAKPGTVTATTIEGLIAMFERSLPSVDRS